MSKLMPKQITDAVPPDSILIEEHHGSTWNDGGSWHTAIFKLSDGSFQRVIMESDYHPNDLMIETVREVLVTTRYYESVQ